MDGNGCLDSYTLLPIKGRDQRTISSRFPTSVPSPHLSPVVGRPGALARSDFASSDPTELLRSNMASSMSRWIRPEVYPLFAAVGAAVGICGFQLVRNITINPEVRVTKQNRAAGILENFAEGEMYKEHSLRKLVRNRSPEIMPSLNKFFTDPK